MNDAARSELILKLFAFAMIGWLLVAVISLVFQVWKKEKQSFRIPWWSVGALGVALILADDDFEILVLGIMMCLYALFVGLYSRLNWFAEYKWWKRD